METKRFFKILGLSAAALVVLLLALFIMSSVFRINPPKAVNYQMASDNSSLAEEGFAAPSAVSRKDLAAGITGSAAMSGSVDTVSAPTAEKKIIKTGNLSLKVEKTDTAAEAIGNIAKVNGGDVYNSNFYESMQGTKVGYLSVRVPYDNFEKTFSEIKAVATQVVSESTNAADITEQYIDLEARLKNKQAEEESFIKLLDRSGKMEDVLAVTKELARVRGEIEQLEGQKRYYDSQVDMSTITVNLSEDVAITPVNKDWRPWQVVKAAVKELIANGQGFVDGTIRFIVIGLPVLFVYALILWILYLIGRKIYHHYRKREQK
jgi:hypothetical protein